MNKTYFIADIAANHDGDLERAKQLCLLAKESGADAAKFQHFKAQTIVSDKGFKDLGSQQSHQSNWNKSVYEVYDDASVPLNWTPELKKYCDEIGIDFFTTPYDLDYVDYLDKFVSCYKIGSGDITWHKMLHKVGSKRKPVIIASGASNINEVVDAVNILKTYGVKICLMQCNTNYTVDVENFKYINLNVLKVYRTMFPDIELGLSDHTPGDITVLGAVSLGATMVEKHFTDDNDREGPDHPFSMNPESWRKMVDSTRILERSMGSFFKKVEDNEKETVILQRRALRLTRNVKKGDLISFDDFEFLRPCPVDAFYISEYKKIIQKPVKRDISTGDYIKIGDIEI